MISERKKRVISFKRCEKHHDAGKSVTKALILESVIPQYDKRLFIELQEKCKYRTRCVEILFWMSKQKTIFVHNMLWTCSFLGIQWTISCHIVG